MMETTDGLLTDVFKTAERFRPVGGLSDAERPAVADELLVYYDDGIINISRLVDICDLYLSGEYRTILTKQYNVEDYAP